MNIIDEFITRYAREYDYYNEVSRMCAQLCELKLNSSGIRSIVTFRAKNIRKLKEKLIKRDKDKNYTTCQEIYDDIPDLSGVRIALYFPGNREEVENIIRTTFDFKEQKHFPEHNASKDVNDSLKYKKVFSGYLATHYRVTLKSTDLSEVNQRYAQANIEIQIASILMHAWAEVEHDLIYKPLQGELSEMELSILDSLNGLVLSGEIALNNLQKAIKDRVDKQDIRFNNHYELASFLADYIKTTKPDKFKELSLQSVNILFRFLQLAKLDKPSELKNILINFEIQEEDFIHRLIYQIIGESTDLCIKYIKASREVKPNETYSTSVETEALATASFLGRSSLVMELINKGADVNPKDEGSISPLVYAIMKNHVDIAKLLVEKGANINTYIKALNGCSLLSLALQLKNIEIVKLLIENKANVNIRDKGKDGATPLQMAIFMKEKEFIEMLRNAGAVD